MKKILMIGTTDFVGGAARVSWDLGKGLVKKGHKVNYIVGYKNSDADRVYELRTNLLLKKLEELSGYNLVALARHFRAFLLSNDLDFGASEEILQHPWYKEADVVHLHNLHGHYFKIDTLLKIAKDKPVVWTLHDMWAITAHCAFCYDCDRFNNGKHYTSGVKRYQAMLCDNSEYLWNKKRKIYKKIKINVITPSRWLAEIANKSTLGNQRIEVINNGVDIQIFSPKTDLKIRKKLSISNSKKIITFVAQGGRLDPRKGGDYFLRVARHYKNDKEKVFICLGGGRRIEKTGNIIYIPFLKSPVELAAYYASSDIFLFASLAENFPLVTLEAMSCGLPVVAFNTGGISEQIGHKKDGFIAKYKNETDLIKGIEWTMSLSEEKNREMRKRIRKKVVDKFSVAKMINKYIKLYEDIS